ncbi:unnamed protein product [Peronospora destructor]|uniref:Uncharacterized protein n=1 Tax=Peronospora destructor TaxID=86335 RepID=A0AAV0TBC5_9STRA|nr:unnamed protein product [Peronospora destructor]
MRPYYFLLLLVTIIKCIEGSLTTHPIMMHAIDNGGPTFQGGFIRSNAVRITETSKKVDEKKPGALKEFLGRLRAIDITGDKKGMVVAYSVLFIALAAILMIGYSIQKHNQETYVH